MMYKHISLANVFTGFQTRQFEPDPDVQSQLEGMLLEQRPPISTIELRADTTQLLGIYPGTHFLSPVADDDRDLNYSRSKDSLGYCDDVESICVVISPDYVLMPSHCYDADDSYTITFPHTQETRHAILSYTGELGFSIFKLDRSVSCSVAPLQSEKPLDSGIQVGLSQDDFSEVEFKEMQSPNLTLASFMDGEGCDRLTKHGDCASVRTDKYTGCIYAIHNGKQKTTGQQIAHPTGIPIADMIYELSTTNQDLANLMIDQLRQKESWNMHVSTAPYMDDELDLEGNHEKFTQDIQKLFNALNNPKAKRVRDTKLSFNTLKTTQYHSFITNLRVAAEQAYLTPNCLGITFKVDDVDCVISTQDDSKWYWVGMKIELSKKITQNEWRSFNNTHYPSNSDKLSFSGMSLYNCLRNIKKWKPKDKANGKNVNDIAHRIDTSSYEERKDLTTFAYFICEAIRFDSVFEACKNCFDTFSEIKWKPWHEKVLKHWDNILKYVKQNNTHTSSQLIISNSELQVWLDQSKEKPLVKDSKLVHKAPQSVSVTA